MSNPNRPEIPRVTRKPLGDAGVGNIEEPQQRVAETPVVGEAVVQRASRPKRIPLGTGDRLKFSSRPGYYRRVVNDDPNNPGRVQDHLDAGYEFVYGDETGGPVGAGDPSKMSRRISKQVGGGITGYLMEIPEEYHQEDLALKHKRIDESEAEMKQEMVAAAGRYGKAGVNDKEEENLPFKR